MRLFIATLSTETNTFSTMPTAKSGFEDYCLRYGDATQEPPNLMTEALHVWRERGEALGWEVVESITAIAEPAGRTTANCYNGFRDQILSDLDDAQGADIILLQLHGAMVAEHEDDCEGDLIETVRKQYPDAILGVSLDLHCHLTRRMIDHCEIILCFKEYPHDDATDRAVELFELARRTQAGEITPVMAAYDCRMIQVYLTKKGRMQEFVAKMKEVESQSGILSVSLGHGFPWADVADVGARMLVVADGDVGLAEKTARSLGKEFFALRQEVTDSYLDLNAAVDEAGDSSVAPVVLADMGDNSGGGAPGDSTFMLEALLKREVSNVATGMYWDPVAVRICEDAGKGSRLRLRIGGKVSSHSGNPVDLDVEVMAIKSGLGQHLGKGLEPMGTVAWLRAGEDFDILINDLRVQVYHPEAFEQMGIDLASKKIITVKSTFHFYGPFSEISDKIIQVASPGGTSPSFTDIPYTKRDDNYWPRVENPGEGFLI